MRAARAHGARALPTHTALLTRVHRLSFFSRRARSNVQNYRFRKQILLVWAFTHRDATLLEQIYTQVPASLRANTVLLITRCNGVDWINLPDRLLE